MLGDELLAMPDSDCQLVEVPEWPHSAGKLFARSLTLEELQSLRPQGDQTRNDAFAALAIVHGIVDAQGQPVFTLEHVGALRTRRCGIQLARLFAGVSKLNGLTAEHAEDIRRDFPQAPTTNGASTSSSPDSSTEASAKCSEATPAAN